MGDPTRGLYNKFDVRRVDGSSDPGGKHHGCDQIVKAELLRQLGM